MLYCSERHIKSVIVTGVTTLLNNILGNLDMFLSAYGRRSYSLLRFWITVARIFCRRWFLSTSCLIFASWQRLAFRAFLSCVFVCGKGFTRLYCRVFHALLDSSRHFSALLRISSRRWYSVRSLGVLDTSRVSKIFLTRSGCTLSSLCLRFSWAAWGKLLFVLVAWVTLSWRLSI
jgi:hypothetical protein